MAILAAIGISTAQAQNTVAFIANGATGPKGSDEPFEAGKTGGAGLLAVDSGFTYAFAANLVSTIPGTPAFSLRYVGGSGGNGGSSTCCNGGSGGNGAIPTLGDVILNGIANVTTSAAPGIAVDLQGGQGGRGGNSGGVGKGGNAGAGAWAGGQVASLRFLNTDSLGDPSSTPWTIQVAGDDSPAMQVITRGGNGGHGGTGDTAGSLGGQGGKARGIAIGTTDAPFRLSATTSGNNAAGLAVLQSPNDGNRFGAGGQGGTANFGTGGQGGAGGTPWQQMLFLESPSILTTGSSSPAVLVLSQGGTGGTGGTGKVISDGGSGGGGGGGGSVDLTATGDLRLLTQGENSHGIAAYSVGGAGGQNGSGSWEASDGQPGAGAASGPVTLALAGATGSIGTDGDEAYGVMAQSIGGHGGNASTTHGLIQFAVNGGSAGNGGAVTVNNGLDTGVRITTGGQSAAAIGASSLGGGGGHGGSAFAAFYSSGGTGGAGGAGSAVSVNNAGALTADNFASDGILAQSIGGAGGSGGSTVALVSVGGRAGPASAGGAVMVQNIGAIETGASPSASQNAGVCGGCALGILAQSIGGGGGKAGTGSGWFDLGGTGGGGGDGGSVLVANAGSVATHLMQSSAILAHSIGGGGGNGGGADGGGAVFSASIGGAAGDGGSGGEVQVYSGAPGNTGSDAVLATVGDSSHGLVGQSIGGGGGNGGFAVPVTASVGTPSLSLGVGGTGGGGGSGGDVTVEQFGQSTAFAASMTTRGTSSHGLLAQSIGGGGGHGGAVVSTDVNVNGGIGLTIGAGGSGGGGGSGGAVNASNTGATIQTLGTSSVGLLAQSTGGGGGDGGLTVAGSVTVGGSNSVDVALGGAAGPGGTGGTVTVDTDAVGAISTAGDHAEGILAQSIGGQGGRGALAVAGSLSSGNALNFGLGGEGGFGNSSGAVTVSAAGVVSTGTTSSGDHSAGIVAQSIAGGGGNGGTSVGAGLSVGNALGLSIGGSGGTGGTAGTVSLTAAGAVSTTGDHAGGLLAQSIGGGGGNGGTSIAGSFTASDSTALNVAVGGSGAAAGTGGTVTVSASAVSTAGMLSDAVLAQSIGGGGGNGGTSIAGSVSTSDSNALGVAVGGAAQSGAGAGSVAVNTPGGGKIAATGNGSRGVVAQSIGGGGGNGGMAITGALQTQSTSKALTVSVGGAAGNGGAGSVVSVNNYADITTGAAQGTGSQQAASQQGEYGILAQSIGGGGGTGGLSVSANANKGSRSLNVTVGGAGGAGATSDKVLVGTHGSVTTRGYQSDAILAQSIAGGGGNALGSMVFSSTNDSSKAINLSIGGSGGGGATAGDAEVILFNAPSITALGLGSRGVVVQSIGGGGGNGGSNHYYSTKGVTSADQASVGIGGAGGTSANGGNVSYFASGFITTGSGAANPTSGGGSYQGHAILLQSIGGGGGSGGTGLWGDSTTSDQAVSLTVGIGGKASGGGDAGSATIGGGTTEYDSVGGIITTTNYNAHGVFLQAIGGGGGNGGTAIAGDVTNNSKKGLTVGIGGSGGAGGNGGPVYVNTSMQITAEGAGSKGIMAQSIGGGGGTGGLGIGGTVTSSSEDDSKQISFGLGGSGGGGGDGSRVTLINYGTIDSGGSALSGALDAMDAIFAQSIGGGGGSGSVGIDGDLTSSGKKKNMELNIGVGLAGGGAGSGGRVAVTNSAALTARGNGSRGILAQSIGGGGGDGGAGIVGNMSTSSDDDSDSDSQLNIGVGSQAGSGGPGGQVIVQNSGAIKVEMLGDGVAIANTAGILAQSIGGGGGNGGIGVKGNVTGSESAKLATVAVGGAGGSGGDAYQGSTASPADAGVSITNSGSISVVGDGGRGIHAQSVGGGGGNGAVGFDGTVSTGGGKTLTLAIGGSGGNGGDGGSVLVEQTGVAQTGNSASDSDTSISQAHGILAQSIGGGGGSGVLTGSLLYGSTASTGTEHGIAMTLGGSGSGGSGGDVSVTIDNPTPYSGGVVTYNYVSHGILAQSIGGGGGVASDLGGIGTATGSDQWAVAIGVGGGSSAGDGGNVTVAIGEANGIQTFGDGSFGILAQSVGGGGGSGGDSPNLSQTANPTQTTKNAVIAINAGGTGGSNGDGGSVTLTSAASGYLGTQGKGAIGLFAQSIGGGGGAAGLGANGLSGTVTVGGSGSAGGNGGAVSVTAPYVVTVADQAPAILAQSVGGGGGVAGSVTFAGTSTFGSGLDMGNGAASRGNGGNVTVNVLGAVSTSGADSPGVFAQSVGGGGGVAGSAGASTGALIGSAGGSGQAGYVDVTVAAGGSVISTGAQSHGIFAQSASGASATGNASYSVLIDVAGKVSATGGGSHGIYAQNSGANMGFNSVSIAAGGQVTGGGVSPVGAEQGAGVFVKGGTGSVIANDGTINSVLGTSGIAIQAVDTNLQVYNGGSITGQIRKASSIDLWNRPTGLLNTGPLLDVDNLTNQGTLSVAGTRTIGSTRVTGNLTQTESGVLAIDVDPSDPRGTRADQLSVGGRANVDGNLSVRLVDTWQPSVGLQSTTILTADGGLSSNKLTATPSAVAQYRLDQLTPNALRLSYDINFANLFILADTNDNQDNIARYIDGIYRAKALDSDIARALIAIEDTASYTRVMNSLSAEIVVDNQTTSLLSGIRFNDALLSCAERSGAYRFFDQGQCGWLRLGGQRFEQRETGDNLGFSEDSWQLAGGGQIDIGNGWHLGGALSYEGSNLNADDSHAGSDGERFQVGISGKRRFEANELSGALAVGYGRFDIGRNPWPGVNIEGTQKLWLYSGQLRAAHRVERGGWTFKPRIDLGIEHLSTDGFEESGGSDFRLRHSGGNNTYTYLQPAIDIATEFETDDGLLIRPKLSLGLTRFLGDSAPSVTSRLASAPADVAPFTTSTKLDKTRLNVAASVDVFTRKDVVVRAEIFGSVSDNSKSYGGGLKVELPF